MVKLVAKDVLQRRCVNRPHPLADLAMLTSKELAQFKALLLELQARLLSRHLLGELARFELRFDVQPGRAQLLRRRQRMVEPVVVDQRPLACGLPSSWKTNAWFPAVRLSASKTTSPPLAICTSD